MDEGAYNLELSRPEIALQKKTCRQITNTLSHLFVNSNFLLVFQIWLFRCLNTEYNNCLQAGVIDSKGHLLFQKSRFHPLD